MAELLTAAQMRAIEKAAIDSGEVTGLELMERAGQGVVEAIFEEWPELAPAQGGGAAPTPPEYLGTKEEGHRAVVLCGPGNNGGDGFVVARLLKEWGWEVEVFFYGDAGKLPADAKVNYDRWGEMGQICPLIEGSLAAAPSTHDGRFVVLSAFADKYDLVVDALFGGGLDRGLPDDLRAFTHATLGNPGNALKTVAIDAPTGRCMDSGKDFDLHDTAIAGLTVTFHRSRLGHYLEWPEQNCGEVRIVDLGLDACFATAKGEPTNKNKVFRKAWNEAKGEHVRLIGGSVFLEQMSKHPTAHKYTHGHALILSGGVGKGGAARLAARGALRIGAGLVTVGCPPEALAENAAQLNAIMLEAVADSGVLAAILKDERRNAICVGPGLGTGERERKILAEILGTPAAAPGSHGDAGGPGSSPGRAVVLDADALTVIAGDAELFGALHENCVLTPHAGEFARLFPDIAEKLNAPATKGPAYSKVDATREAAARAGCVVLFKGADTVIAAPDGRCSINSAHYERSAPWLATAGSGDVLAGFITGLLARGFAPMEAAETAAWLHVECALRFGPGLIAEDLPEQLPAVFADLGV